jgi:hypothetical protein
MSLLLAIGQETVDLPSAIGGHRGDMNVRV